MSRPALSLALLDRLEAGQVHVEALFSTPVLRAVWPAGGPPRLVIAEATTTIELHFLALEDLLAFQHTLAHLAIPRGPGR